MRKALDRYPSASALPSPSMAILAGMLDSDSDIKPPGRTVSGTMIPPPLPWGSSEWDPGVGLGEPEGGTLEKEDMSMGSIAPSGSRGGMEESQGNQSGDPNPCLL